LLAFEELGHGAAARDEHVVVRGPRSSNVWLGWDEPRKEVANNAPSSPSHCKLDLLDDRARRVEPEVDGAASVRGDD
jgi:hypothetical protein